MKSKKQKLTLRLVEMGACASEKEAASRIMAGEVYLGEQKADTAKKSFENSVMDQLANLVSAEIPDCMVDTAVENMLTEFRYNVEERGIPFDKYMQMLGMTEESVRGMYRPRAEKEVKTELALEKIAALENIAVEDDEIEEEFKKMAGHYGVKLEDVKAAITAERVKKDLKNRKAADLVLENAVEKAEEEKAGDAE